MLSKEAIENLKKDWYTFEEIQSINDSLNDIDQWNVVDFEKVIDLFYKEKKMSYV
jgi:hypothetical protein